MINDKNNFQADQKENSLQGKHWKQTLGSHVEFFYAPSEDWKLAKLLSKC